MKGSARNWLKWCRGKIMWIWIGYQSSCKGSRKNVLQCTNMSNLDAMKFVTDLSAISARPKTYQKGPDVMSKSGHTQSWYRARWKSQTSLDAFTFTKGIVPALNPCVVVPEMMLSCPVDQSGGHNKSVTHDQWATNSTVSHARPASELSDSSISELEDTLSSWTRIYCY